jgi:hypothetical protein
MPATIRPGVSLDANFGENRNMFFSDQPVFPADRVERTHRPIGESGKMVRDASWIGKGACESVVTYDVIGDVSREEPDGLIGIALTN